MLRTLCICCGLWFECVPIVMCWKLNCQCDSIERWDLRIALADEGKSMPMCSERVRSHPFLSISSPPSISPSNNAARSCLPEADPQTSYQNLKNLPCSVSLQFKQSQIVPYRTCNPGRWALEPELFTVPLSSCYVWLKCTTLLLQ